MRTSDLREYCFMEIAKRFIEWTMLLCWVILDSRKMYKVKYEIYGSPMG